jgi:hypothetical protein
MIFAPKVGYHIMFSGELSYMAPLGSENFPPPISSSVSESNTTPPSPKTEITKILFHILNFASIIKFKT